MVLPGTSTFQKSESFKKSEQRPPLLPGASGETNSTSSSLASPSPSGSATSGGSPTSATKMEEVSFLTFPTSEQKTFSLRKLSILIETADYSETL